jgi:hypothetical protein
LITGVPLRISEALRRIRSVDVAAVFVLQSSRSAVSAPALILVSSDLELNAAAMIEGLSFDDPSLHP